MDQAALIVPDLEAAMDAYAATLDVKFGVFEVTEPASSFSGSSPQFRIRIAVALAGLTSIELIQPVSGVTLYSQHLESRGHGDTSPYSSGRSAENATWYAGNGRD